MRRSMLVLLAVGTVLFTGLVHAADFALGFQGCPDRLTGAPGEKKTFEVIATLTTTNNTSPDGAQGWSMGIAAEGGTITNMTVEGVHVSTIFQKAKPPAPPINPSDMDLIDAPTAVAETTAPASPKQGAVSAVVLALTQKRVLQPTGTQTIAKLTVEGTIPEGSNCVPLTLTYTDGLVGSGQPVNNVVTFGGQSNKPTLGSCTIELCPIGLEFVYSLVPAGKAPAPDGDNVLAESRPPGTHLVPVDLLLTTASLPPGDGPQGWSASIGHQPCMEVDSVTVEGVHVSTIFQKAKPPAPPIDPSDMDLIDAPTAVAETTAPGTTPGVVSAVVLALTQKRVLHANATDTILRIVYKVTLTEAQLGQTVECKASVVDGLQGSGQPVNNIITLGGQSKRPTRTQALTIRFTVERARQDFFIRGDANNDGKIDIGDAISIVYAVVPTLPGEPIGCQDSGDANDDEQLNLPDAVYIINYQFQGGPKPPTPVDSCGTDDDSNPTKCPPDSTQCAPAA